MKRKVVEIKFNGKCADKKQVSDIICFFDENTSVIATNIQKRNENIIGKVVFAEYILEGYSVKTKESIDYLKSLGLTVKILEKIA